MRTHMVRSQLRLAATLLLAACGGDDDDDGGGAATCEELAAIVGDCGGDTSEAEFVANICSRIVLSGDCLQEAGSADCAEHDSDSPSYEATCFPSCDSDASECVGTDSLRLCLQGTEFVLRCGPICEDIDATFTGTCADEFEGMPSESGQDVCWCE